MSEARPVPVEHVPVEPVKPVEPVEPVEPGLERGQAERPTAAVILFRRREQQQGDSPCFAVAARSQPDVPPGPGQPHVRPHVRAKAHAQFHAREQQWPPLTKASPRTASRFDLSSASLYEPARRSTVAVAAALAVVVAIAGVIAALSIGGVIAIEVGGARTTNEIEIAPAASSLQASRDWPVAVARPSWRHGWGSLPRTHLAAPASGDDVAPFVREPRAQRRRLPATPVVRAKDEAAPFVRVLTGVAHR